MSDSAWSQVISKLSVEVQNEWKQYEQSRSFQSSMLCAAPGHQEILQREKFYRLIDGRVDQAVMAEIEELLPCPTA